MKVVGDAPIFGKTTALLAVGSLDNNPHHMNHEIT
jgi:hypothetical protein